MTGDTSDATFGELHRLKPVLRGPQALEIGSTGFSLWCLRGVEARLQWRGARL